MYIYSFKMEKRYAVVYLPAESIYSEVPVNWLTADKTQCWWPKSINARAYMVRDEKPNKNTWQLHDVTIEGYSATLEGARRKAESPEYTSQEELIETGRGRRKKFSKNRSSSEESNACTPPPSPSKFLSKTSRVIKKITDSSQRGERGTSTSNEYLMEKDARNNDAGNSILAAYTPPSTPSTTSTHSNKNVPNKSPTTSAEHFIEYNEDFNQNSSQAGAANDEYYMVEETGASDLHINEMPIEILTGELTENHLSQFSANRIISICLENQKCLNNIYQILQQMVLREGGANNTANKEDIFSEKLPLADINKLKEFEEELNQHAEMKQSYITYMKAVGGRDPKDNVNRCLARTFGHDLGTGCSWLGLRGNYKIQNLTSIKLIIDIVMLRYRNLIQLSDVEKNVSEWFRLSKQRLQREKK